MTAQPSEQRHVNTAAKGGAVAIASTLVFNGLRLAAAGYLTRLLDPLDYGRYVLGLSVFMLLSGVSLFGMPQAMLRWMSAYCADEDFANMRYFQRRCALVVIVGAAICGLAFYFSSSAIAGFLGDDGAHTALVLFLWALPPFLATELLAAAARSAKDIVGCSLIKEILPIVFQLAGIAIAARIAPTGAAMIASFAIAYTISALLGAIYLLTRRRQLFRGPATRPEAFCLRTLIGFAASMSLIGLLFVLCDRAAVLLIAKHVTPVEAGVYYNASRLAILLTIMASGFNRILAPQIASLTAQQNRRDLQVVYHSVMRWSILLAFPFLVLMLSKPDVFMRLAFGDESPLAAQLLAIMVCLRFAVLFLGVPSLVLQMTGHQRHDLLAAVVSVVAVCGALHFLLPAYGVAIGAAAAGFAALLVDALRCALVYAKTGLTPLSRSDAVKIGSVLLLVATPWAVASNVTFTPPLVLCIAVAAGATLALCALIMSGTDKRLVQLALDRLLPKRAA